MCVYKVVSKIFRTDAVKIVKLTIRLVGRRHPPVFGQRSHPLLHFWNASWKSFSITVSSTLCDSACISSMVSNRRPYRFSFIFGNRKKSQGAKSGEHSGWGITVIFFFQFSSVQTLTRCCFWSAVRILGTNLAATQ